MIERPTPTGSGSFVPLNLESLTRYTPTHTDSPLIPTFDVPQAVLTRPTAEFPREAAQPMARDRAARRFAAWIADPALRPAYSIKPSAGRPLGIAAALACPDLFLLETPLGQERLNAIVALVEGARESGQRLAILTATPDNANAIVLALPPEGLGRAKAEREDDLPPVVAVQTAQVLAQADWRSRRSALLAQQQDAIRQLKWWNEWNRVTEATEKLATNGAELATRAESTVEESGEFKPLADELASLLASSDAANRTDAEIRKVLEAQLTESRSAAGQGLGGFVKKLFGGAKAGLTDAVVAAEAKLRDLDASAAERTRRSAEAEERIRVHRAARSAEELAKLQAEHDGRRAAANREREALNSTRPSAGREQLQATLREIEAKLADSEHPPAAPPREIIQKLSVVVGPFDSLDHCPFFAPTHPEAEPPFDRVLFADAEDLNEPDYTRAARLADAHTMFGSMNLPGPVYRNGKPGRGEFFRDTFGAVGTSPWRFESGRTVALFAKADPRSLRIEPLADNPGIELRFHDRPDGQTVLAEVVFPLGFALIESKRFLLAELGIAKSHFLGAPEWMATSDDVVCFWPDHSGVPFDLAPGIREYLAGIDTTQFRFALAEGWTRELAEEWFREHFGSYPATRAAVLPRR